MNIIIHMSDWNFQDRAYLFPEHLIPELIARVKLLPIKGKGWLGNDYDWEHNKTWDWFVEHCESTIGIENADYFLDYHNPVECVEEWEE
jgi:hypothetical protein